MKKKYRVTTRGKIVFPLIFFLLLYGIYVFFTQLSEAQVDDDSLVSEEVVLEKSNSKKEIGATQVENTENSISVESDVKVEEPVSEQGKEDTQNENYETNKISTNPEALRLIEDAGFTIYYEPNSYYVPEGDIAYIAEFSSVAQKYPEEQIIIEGNVNKSNGPKQEWDTENVNQLGYTRSLVIKNDLIKRGIDGERIIIYNNKDEKPLNVDLSKKSIALNRRVDVFFSQFMYNEIDTK